jgi:hypothetical protein
MLCLSRRSFLPPLEFRGVSIPCRPTSENPADHKADQQDRRDENEVASRHCRLISGELRWSARISSSTLRSRFHTNHTYTIVAIQMNE